MFALFSLGQVVATPGALAALERTKQSASCFLARHATGIGGHSTQRMSPRTSTTSSTGFV